MTFRLFYERIADISKEKEFHPMKKSVICLLLCLCMILAGCGEVAGEIAGNVADAAKKELENQIKTTFETYKIEILDMKTAAGKLSGESGDIQFFCAVLVQSESDAVPTAIAENLSKMFHDAGITVQTESVISNDYLEHKELSFKFDSFGDGKAYYCVWCYTDKLPSLDDLKEITSNLSTDSVG